MTMRQFVNRYKVRIESSITESNPHMTDMVAGSVHWRVTLKVGRRQMSLHYSQGPAIVHEPEADEVLDCLASDAASFVNSDCFEDWAREFGYDTDSRHAEKVYKAVERQYAQLQRLFTPDALETLLYHTESL